MLKSPWMKIRIELENKIWRQVETERFGDNRGKWDRTC